MFTEKSWTHFMEGKVFFSRINHSNNFSHKNSQKSQDWLWKSFIVMSGFLWLFAFSLNIFICSHRPCRIFYEIWNAQKLFTYELHKWLIKIQSTDDNNLSEKNSMIVFIDNCRLKLEILSLRFLFSKWLFYREFACNESRWYFSCFDINKH